MLDQERIFKIWGFAGNLAIRNIIVFFLLAQMSAIVYYVDLNNRKDKVIDEAKKALVEAKEETTRKVEQLNEKHLKSVQDISDYFKKQSEIERDVRETAQNIEKLTKRRR